MSFEKLTQKYASAVALTAGGGGLTTWLMNLGEFVQIVGQLILLCLSIFSVLIGIYIAWPNFVAKWRAHGGFRIFARKHESPAPDPEA